MDLRNNAHLPSGTFGYASFNNSKIERFVVDDISNFNQLLSQGKITIQNNSPNDYQVVTSSVPCERILANQEIRNAETSIFPNPVSNTLNLKPSVK